MDIGDFLTDFKLQLPDLKGRSPHAISVHIGWLNWGNVGDVAFDELVEHAKAQKIGEFERPGDFYNFVAYRDRSRSYIDNEGVRRTEFPNAVVYYVRRAPPLSDLVLVHLLEPTQFGEVYVDRVVALLKRLNVVSYQVIGAMGSHVPHTRPIRVTGRSSTPETTERLKKIGVRETMGGQYQGPTSIFNTISSKLQSEGITTVSLIAHLPTYFSLQEADFNGVFSILNVLSKLEGIEIPLERFESVGRQQYDTVSKEVRLSQSLTALSQELENIYDQEEEKGKEEETTRLPPSIQKAIDEAFDKN
ncbi:MAG: PAC2 family protein [Chloroflexi bacterium]|nr:PAC2 family protein [Chloroflexota bacterium]